MYTEPFNRGFSRLQMGIKLILIITISTFVLQIFFGRIFVAVGSLISSKVIYNFNIWRLITYAFLHGDTFHLLFNMLALWMFGSEIEEKWGTKRFLIFYGIASVGSGIFSLFSLITGDVPIIGASGAILALLTIYAHYFPDRKLYIFFLFSVPVRVAVLIFGGVSLVSAMNNSSPIAHITHLGGIIIALVYLKYYDQVFTWYTHRCALKAERTMRHNAEFKIQQDRFFEEKVDPILKKISKHGIDSLTVAEHDILNKVSKN